MALTKTGGWWNIVDGRYQSTNGADYAIAITYTSQASIADKANSIDAFALVPSFLCFLTPAQSHENSIRDLNLFVRHVVFLAATTATIGRFRDIKVRGKIGFITKMSFRNVSKAC